MLQFCNVSVRLTPDTLSHVNNESDDPRVQEIEGTRWHMAERMRHADFLLHCLFFALSISAQFFLHLVLSPVQTLIFNPLIWSPLTLLTPAFPFTHLSIIRLSWIPQRRRGQLGEKSRVDELNRRCSEEGGVCWTSGCGPQLSARLLPDLEEIRKLGDPQPVGSNSHWGKKKNPSISLLHELLRYWPTASKIYRRVVCLSFRISHTLHLVRLSIFLSLSPLAFSSLLCLPFFPHSDLPSCASEIVNQITNKAGEREKERQRKTVCYSHHKRLFLPLLKKSVYH